jgi:hypothetical protein
MPISQSDPTWQLEDFTSQLLACMRIDLFEAALSSCNIGDAPPSDIDAFIRGQLKSLDIHARVQDEIVSADTMTALVGFQECLCDAFPPKHTNSTTIGPFLSLLSKEWKTFRDWLCLVSNRICSSKPGTQDQTATLLDALLYFIFSNTEKLNSLVRRDKGLFRAFMNLWLSEDSGGRMLTLFQWVSVPGIIPCDVFLDAYPGTPDELAGFCLKLVDSRRLEVLHGDIDFNFGEFRMLLRLICCFSVMSYGNEDVERTFRRHGLVSVCVKFAAAILQRLQQESSAGRSIIKSDMLLLLSVVMEILNPVFVDGPSPIIEACDAGFLELLRPGSTLWQLDDGTDESMLSIITLTGLCLARIQVHVYHLRVLRHLRMVCKEFPKGSREWNNFPMSLRQNWKCFGERMTEAENMRYGLKKHRPERAYICENPMVIIQRGSCTQSF